MRARHPKRAASADSPCPSPRTHVRLLTCRSRGLRTLGNELDRFADALVEDDIDLGVSLTRIRAIVVDGIDPEAARGDGGSDAASDDGSDGGSDDGSDGGSEYSASGSLEAAVDRAEAIAESASASRPLIEEL